MIEFRTIQDLVNLADQRNESIGHVVLLWESESSEKSVDILQQKMRSYWDVMKQSMKQGLSQDIQSVTGLTGGDAKRVNTSQPTIISNVLKQAIARSLAVAEVNAAMKKIVAAPTAGSSGIIPAAVYVTLKKLNLPEERAIEALFTASGIGVVIANHAPISGAEGGCQAECGVASAMAAAAIVDMAGGTPRQIGDAVALSLKNLLGLVCDPVAGLVEVPCIKRNVIGVVNAIVAAELALAGVKSVIPVDEVIMALNDVSKRMPLELKETACGGLAITPTGRALTTKVYQSLHSN
ncbi:MAG: L-serine ammonia-lyase, iron-sulfur-dependent, subunit alpha [Candidatus Bathyarchaeota archaeon]|jgi:L-serine dehydratase|nr:L-serine ammonia-lyase, iron-sulfur-dependent, subunit alpha [Candidatus Bathyarchaeota archaeon]